MGDSAPIEELEKQKEELERLVEVKTKELNSINDVLLQKIPNWRNQSKRLKYWKV